MSNSIEEIYSIFKKSSGISTDTRSIKENSIYFALKGPNFNGNHFAEDALEKGAILSVVDDKSLNGISNNFIIVRDSLKTLQDLAKYHREKLNIPFVGITGSNGKTTTKSLIEKVLSSKYKVRATEGNLNNHIGVPLSVLNVSDNDEIAVIEMGASAVGEIKLLSEICRPTIGLITNISNAHVKGFKNIEGVIRGKSELFDYLLKNDGKVIINNFDEVINNFSKRFVDAIHLDGKSSIVNVTLIESTPQIKFSINDNDIFISNLFGEYNFQNILFALTVGKYFNIDLEQSSKIVSKYIPNNNRSEKLDYKSNCIILDAYNANPTSMEKAINAVFNFKNKNKVMILGDMNELGDQSNSEHLRIGKLIKTLKINHVFFIGNKMRCAHDENPDSMWFEKVDDLIKGIKKLSLKNSDILIKGSRSLKLEKSLEVIKQISV
ncbi:MAG: UDP-N-acetylmuramoyl-tripeptide--D-alanyl-D-alanine ligase [Flammeovirgaceae bacterium]